MEKFNCVNLLQAMELEDEGEDGGEQSDEEKSKSQNLEMFPLPTEWIEVLTGSQKNWTKTN